MTKNWYDTISGPLDRNYGYSYNSRTRILEIDKVRYVCDLNFSLDKEKIGEVEKDNKGKVPKSPYQETSSLYLHVSWSSSPDQFSGSLSVKVQDTSTISYEYNEMMNKYIASQVTSLEKTEALKDFETYFENTIIPLIEKDIKSTILKDSRNAVDVRLLSEGESLLRRESKRPSTSTRLGDNF